MDTIRDELSHLLGSPPARIVPIGGGDIGTAFRVERGDGGPVFAKTYPGGSPEMVAREAAGLRWLADGERPTTHPALRVAAVRAVSSPRARQPVLVLDWIESGRRASDFDERLGRGLARLHGRGAPAFGLEIDNFIGRLPQANVGSPESDWAGFYAARRLEPLISRVRDTGLAGESLATAARRLLERLPELVGPPEPPARLHGDLWAGNLLVAEDGSPCLIDPAVYGGHREMDLAMMRLFGGFAERTFDAYAESHPLSAGWEDRVELCQLYPLLVHAILFGGGYVSSVERVIRHYAG